MSSSDAPAANDGSEAQALKQQTLDNQLWSAVRDCDLPGVLSALAAGANPTYVNSNEGSTPLLLYTVGHALFGDENVAAEMVDALLRAGADPNCGNVLNDTPLRFCLFNDLFELAQRLVAGGANVNSRDSFGVPLLFQVRHSYEAVCFLLDQPNLDVMARSRLGGQTVISNASDADERTLAKLIDASGGALLNMAAEDGRTPLHYACLSARWELALFLLTKGAKAHLVDKLGKTPLDVATEYDAEQPFGQGDEAPAELIEKLRQAIDSVGKSVKSAKK